jgi:hypothetical protein
MTNQYEQERDTTAASTNMTKSDQSTDATVQKRLARLEERIRKQDLVIDTLLKDLRRYKSVLDAHSHALNNRKDG